MEVKLKTYWEIIKVIVVVAILVFVCGSGYKIYNYLDNKLDQQQNVFNQKMEDDRRYKQYADNLVRANTELVASLKEEIERLKSDNSQAMIAMLEEIKENNEKINNIGETTVKLKENMVELRVSSDHTYKVGTGDTNEQYFKKIYYETKDENGVLVRVPVAWTIFYPNRPLGQRWKSGVYPLEYHTTTVQSEQEDGQTNTYTKVWMENNKDRESRGIQIPLSVTSSEFKQLVIEDTRFYWWAPHLSTNLDLGLSSDLGTSTAAGLSFSTSGYGRTKNDLIWKFVEFGVSSNGDRTYFKFSPFSYNIGEHIPIISNTFLGPFVGYSTEGDMVFGIGLSIPF